MSSQGGHISPTLKYDHSSRDELGFSSAIEPLSMDPSPPPLINFSKYRCRHGFTPLNLLENFSSIGIDVGHPSWDPPGF